MLQDLCPLSPKDLLTIRLFNCIYTELFEKHVNQNTCLSFPLQLWTNMSRMKNFSSDQIGDDHKQVKVGETTNTSEQLLDTAYCILTNSAVIPNDLMAEFRSV